MSSPSDPWARRFRVSARITLAAIYFLILFGASVRATGSGMGCPDWPKCFGLWIPPTDVSQLPPNYTELYPYYEGVPFNAFHTWTEYMNRLTGATVGLLTIVTFALSFAYWRRDRMVSTLSLAAVLLTGFAGWLGKEVVGSHLTPAMITAHMAVALGIVAALAWAVSRSQREAMARLPLTGLKAVQAAIVFALILSIVQIFLGTRVRESVDLIADQMGESLRHEWALKFGMAFYVHRTFSILVLVVNVGIAAMLWRRAAGSPWLRRLSLALVGLVGSEVVTGASLYYLGMPAVLQPVHLLLATIMFGTQVSLLLSTRYHGAHAGQPTTHAAAAI